jgi:hypothetical protein
MRPVIEHEQGRRELDFEEHHSTGQKKTSSTSGEVRTHALKEDQNLSLAP